MSTMFHNKQLLDEVFVMSRIIKVRGKCYQPSQRPRLVTLTESLFILGYQKNESNDIIVLLYVVLKKITTNTLSQGT